MTFSSLIAGTLPHHGKYGSRSGAKISRVIPHHWAGFGTSGRDTLTNPNRKASANYIIMNGLIYGQVPEEYRAWTTGSASVDRVSITFEIQNSSGRTGTGDSDPNSWKISAANFAAAAQLIADIARRYGWNDIGSSRVRFHREFASTSCPGGYLWANREELRSAALKAFSGGSTAVPAPTPSTPAPVTGGDPSTTIKGRLAKMGLAQSRQGVIAYQKAHGLWADGLWGAVTERWYQYAVGLQNYLNTWKRVSPKLVVDGYLGKKTARAITQAKAGQTKAVPYRPPTEPSKLA